MQKLELYTQLLSNYKKNRIQKNLSLQYNLFFIFKYIFGKFNYVNKWQLENICCIGQIGGCSLV